MDTIREILEKLVKGKIDIDNAYEELKFLPFKELGHTKIDTHRKIRTSLEEVIYGANKTIEELIEIIDEYIKIQRNIMITKLEKDKAKLILDKYNAKYFQRAKILILKQEVVTLNGNIIILSAGTSDIPVAEEAFLTAEFLGSKVEVIYDVGIAGIHRLLEYKDKINSANVIIAVAGMDGALPAVVAGMFGKPVIGVPTSVGYGVNFKGVAPMLTMLNSCAPGVVVVNIDNGFGAGVFAHLINK